MNRSVGLVLLFVVLVCAVSAGTWYYKSRCWGMDACAAAEAESHEREKPAETQ